ncbi:Xylosidase/arabinosidase [Apiospora aurea]|uniref:Xylosidase/arabinosidase n=1 Tax=Apiospora aurea TaxID=335848 RepID=A0ABR1Q3A1_9PEZI
MTPPLITTIYTADPSAHVFNGRVYIYPSHDRETGIAFNDNGDQAPYTDLVDHGVVLRTEDVPWASKQLWAPDAAQGRDGKFYLYFPARDQQGNFRIGVAVGDAPEGPFVADPDPIPGSFSIDPASFVDPDTGDAYLYFGGLWGGQLQCYQTPAGQNDGANFDAAWSGPKEPSGPTAQALFPKYAKLDSSMRAFTPDGAQDLVILAPETGEPLAADDHARRFFEAAWMHKRGDTYYFSYSTGDTHYLVYATSKSPTGPFTYGGRILEPVLGWTTHHSIVEFQGRWWLFHHDCELSKGVNHLRCVKVRELFYDEDGKMFTKQD